MLSSLQRLQFQKLIFLERRQAFSLFPSALYGTRKSGFLKQKRVADVFSICLDWVMISVCLELGYLEFIVFLIIIKLMVSIYKILTKIRHWPLERQQRFSSVLSSPLAETNDWNWEAEV